VELTLTGQVEPESGFVVDFFDVEVAFGPVLAALDHTHLNKVDGLSNPTAENIAIWIWKQVQPELPQLSSIRVFETPNCWAEYEGESGHNLKTQGKSRAF
jgi:6-pyruvoyltetrahydropterin/6-carboxytetrahydropterin synthase